MSVGAGLYFNSSLLNQAAGVMIVNDEQYSFGPEWYRFAAVALAIQMCIRDRRRAWARLCARRQRAVQAVFHRHSKYIRALRVRKAGV